MKKTELEIAKKNLSDCEKKLAKASKARFELELGASRARVTTANARLNALCEARDRYADIVNRLSKNK